MSQTETLLLIILGFALATLIALFLGRMVWHMAMRLGARRMQRQVPSTVAGLQTERDRLRAEYAMVSQRLGSRLEAVKLQMAEQMAEVSRHRNRLETTEAALAERAAEAERLAARIQELEAEVAAKSEANAKIETILAAREEELAATRQQIDQILAAGSPAPVAAALDDSASEASPGDRLHQRISKLTSMARTVAVERGQHTAETAQMEADNPATADPVFLGKLNEAERETADIQKQLEELDAEWSKRLGEIKEPPVSEDAQSQPRAIANVISLANRIRALQKDIPNQ